MEAKAYGFFSIMCVFLGFAIITLLFLIVNRKIHSKHKKIVYFLYFFLISALISTLFSYSPKNAFLGLQGWYIGFFVIASLVLTIQILKYININNNYAFYPIYITICILFIITILHSAEIDIFNMHEGILYESYHKYLSTIGNINWYAGYLSIIAPLFSCLFINSSNRKDTTIYGTISFLSVICVAMLGSDGIYLALLFGSFFIIPFLVYGKKRMERFSYLIFAYLTGLLLARYLDYCMDGISAITRQLKFIIPCFIFGFSILLISKCVSNDLLKRKHKTICITVISVILLSIVALGIYILNMPYDDWGTGRLVIWAETIIQYCNFTFYNKMFGLGPELLNNIYAPLTNLTGAVYFSSHSELFQILVTMGAIGLILWLCCWFCLFADYFKTKSWIDSKMLPFYISFFCYFGQSLVNSATTLNVCTLSLVMIVYLSLIEESDSK